jgi:polysaccharide export outer membrane protein
VATHSAFSSFSVGASGCLLAFAAWSGVVAANPGGNPTSDSAEVRIALPAGGPHSVSVSLEGGVVVELPRGAAVPFDLVAAGGGLLRSGEMTDVSETRVRLVLRLASGLLAQVRYEPDAVVLRFTRRGTSTPVTSLDPANSYRLGIDDKVQITVDGQPDLTRQYAVGAAGMISAPMLGEIQAQGLTVDQLGAEVTERLARDFLVDPRVNVEVIEYKSRWAMVTGAVRSPGRVVLKGGTDLKEAISTAGGIAPEAGDEIVLSRKTEGKDQSPPVRIARQDFENGEANPLLENGDVISVSKAEYCYVQGEVRSSGRVPIEKELTLLRAISLVGGFTEWANKKHVQVLGRDPSAPARTYNVKDIESRKIPDPKLRAGDQVIVRRRVL